MNDASPSGVIEIEHCWIPMADGVRLSARLWLPAGHESMPVPAVLEYIPYRKRDMVRARDERNHVPFAQAGYAAVRVDMRGSGDSEGLMSDMYGSEELDDAVAVINWLATQPWCDGSVGMMGTSWGGTASFQAAARRPAALRAIIAVCATNNRYDDDIHHMGGCVLTDTVEWGATLPAILASPPDPETVGPGWRELWLERLENLTFPLENWVKHQTCDGYWRQGSVNQTPDAITCPVLCVGGWADRYSNTVMNFLAETHAQAWGIIGPWGHHYPDVGSPGPGFDFQSEAIRWWDHWLKGKPNGIDQEPRLRVWMQDYQPPEDKLANRAGGWTVEPNWPSDNVNRAAFFLAPGRLTRTPAASAKIVEVPLAPEVGRAAGDTGYFGRFGGLPLAQQEDDAACLIFETEPLEEPLEILGQVEFAAMLTSAAPKATLVARLNDVPPEGDVARVTYGVQNLELTSEGLPGADRGATTVKLANTAYKVRRGHKLRLALSASYWPLIWPSPSAVAIGLNTKEACLHLALRSAALKPTDPPMPSARARDQSANFTVLTAPPLERTPTGWHQPFRNVLIKPIGLEFGYETTAEHTTAKDDPSSARSKVKHRMRFKRGDWTVDIHSRAELTSSAKMYHPCGDLEVIENGERLFHRSWACEPVHR